MATQLPTRWPATWDAASSGLPGQVRRHVVGAGRGRRGGAGMAVTAHPATLLTRCRWPTAAPGSRGGARGASAARQPGGHLDPLGRPVAGEVLLADDGTGYLESAQACGLHLLAPAERDPKTTTSYGLGLLLATAVESGARETVVIGLGGSATNDGGAGHARRPRRHRAGPGRPRPAVRRCGAGRVATLDGDTPAARRLPGRRDRRGQPADSACTARATCSARRRVPSGRTYCCWTRRWNARRRCSSATCPAAHRGRRAARWRRGRWARRGDPGPVVAGASRASAWSRRAIGLDDALASRRPGDHRRGLLRPPVAAWKGGRRRGRGGPGPRRALRGAGRTGRAPGGAGPRPPGSPRRTAWWSTSAARSAGGHGAAARRGAASASARLAGQWSR